MSHGKAVLMNDDGKATGRQGSRLLSFDGGKISVAGWAPKIGAVTALMSRRRVSEITAGMFFEIAHPPRR